MLIHYNGILSLTGFLTGLSVWSLFVDDYGFRMRSDPRDKDTDRSAGPTVWPGWRSIESIFAFGDAMTDTYFSPTGSQPSLDFPFGNSDRLQKEGTILEHPSWINILQSRHGESRLLVYNLARWNATTERHAYYAHKNGQAIEYNGVSFDEQVMQFQVSYTGTFRPPKIAAPWTGANSLFIIWFGADDIADNVERQLPLPIDPLFASCMASMEQLYASGARNFLMLNAPPTNRIHADPMHFVGDDISNYNFHVLTIQKKMLERHSDAVVMLFDVNSLLNRALDDPTRYPDTRGITNVTAVCDHNRDDCKGYFWRSTRNVTEPVMDFIAAIVANDCLRMDKPAGFCSDGLR